MTTEDDFLRAIDLDEYDDLLRNVYADWLEEHNRPEEAARQRKWVEAREWMENFVEGHDDGNREFNEPEGFDEMTNEEQDACYDDDDNFTEGEPVNVDEVIDAASAAAESDDSWYGFGYFQGQSDSLNDPYDRDRDKFWECIYILTGVRVSEERKEKFYFKCAC